MHIISRTRMILMCAIFACVGLANAQKVKVGFDKSVDFTKYRTYSWVKIDPSVEPTMRRLVVMMEVDGALKSKGLQRVEDGGDLIISGSGGFGGEMGGEHQGFIAPSASASVYPYGGIWTGTPYAPGSMVVGGTLLLDIADRASNRIVWQGAVTTKLDTDNRQKLIERVRKAVVKLLEQYPPK